MAWEHYIYEHCTERARQVMREECDEAARWGQPGAAPEHLLLALLRHPDARASLILTQLGVELEALRADVRQQLKKAGQREHDHAAPASESGKALITPRTRRVLELALEEARRLDSNAIGTEHLLLGLLREGESAAAALLAEKGITLEKVRGALQEALLTLDEAVQFLGTSRPTLYRLLRQGDLSGLKVGKQWRFHKSDLLAYMTRGPVAVAAAPGQDLDPEMAFFADELQRLDVPEEAYAAEEGPAGAQEERVQALVNAIVALALASRASDIHLEPVRREGEAALWLRYRIDGALQPIRRLPASLHEPLTLAIKQRAEMELGERRQPQSGRFPIFAFADREFELRAATIPTLYGEAVTVRIIDKTDTLTDLEALGLEPEDLAQVREWIHQPNGLLVVAGPVGSGKTTLLLSCLREIAEAGRKLFLLDDPIEHVPPHTTPVPVGKKAGLSYPVALRALFLQDPDVVLIGQMLEAETVQAAAELALTGHLALAGMSANSAVDALQRLLELGVERFPLSASLQGIVALRLARRVCPQCKEAYTLDPSHSFLTHVRPLSAAGGYPLPEELTLYRGRGCDRCRQTGYKGRIGLFELLPWDEALAEAALLPVPGQELADLAAAGERSSLIADGMRKAMAGLTTIDEVLRVTSTRH
ncbi:MAG TPA: ATPase, T2SS/T4P/T4SS family [Chthonomonadaceae bacterium]|nr:ATPase, T2SS/T4P/T4SS family [Chthonomonadaceae bacterium]